MSWIEPICDRSQQDVEQRTAKGYCNAADLNRLENNSREVAALMAADRGWMGQLDFCTDWQSDSLPTQAELERICDNLAALAAGYAACQTTPPPPLPPLNHWQKWNAAEQLLEDQRQSLLAHRRDKAYSGQLLAGDMPGIK